MSEPVNSPTLLITMTDGRTVEFLGDDMRVSEAGALIISRLAIEAPAPLQRVLILAPRSWLMIHEKDDSTLVWHESDGPAKPPPYEQPAF